jgi:CRP-like cAMP-binding protein
MSAPFTTTIYDLFKDEHNTIPFSAGQIIFERDQPGKDMYVILDGVVDIVIQDTVINTIGKGEILGEMALVDNRIRSATAVAKTDCKLVSIDEDRFTFLVQNHPSFALSIMRILAERLRRRTES